MRRVDLRGRLARPVGDPSAFHRLQQMLYELTPQVMGAAAEAMLSLGAEGLAAVLKAY